MMNEKYPSWLTNHVKEWAKKRLTTLTSVSYTHLDSPRLQSRYGTPWQA